ncbi:hypothetical protein [Streptomyces sp. NPDC002676]
MKRSRMLRRAVAGCALAGIAVAGFGFIHIMQPDPDWTGGLHRTTAVVKIEDRMMKPDPEFGGG